MFSKVKQYSADEQKLIKQLKTIADDYPQSELNLSPFKEVLTIELLEPLLVNANKYLKELTLDKCSKLTEDTIHLIAKHCPTLTYLSTQHMPWKEWSTWGIFSDSKFPELISLCIDGCFNLRKIYIIAPKLQNLAAIATAFYKIKTAGWTKWASLIYDKKDHTMKLNVNKTSYSMGAIQTHVETSLANDLINNRIKELCLNEWGNPIPFMGIIAEHSANSTSLTSLTINSKSLKLHDLEPLLKAFGDNSSLETLNLSDNALHLTPLWFYGGGSGDIFRKLLKLPLKVLDLSKNNIRTSLDTNAIANIVSTHPSLQKLYLSDNDLGCNKGLLNLITALKINKTLKELKLDGSEIKDQQYYFNTYTTLFDDTSLIPFFNMLAKQQTIQSLSLAGYFTDKTALSVSYMLKENQTLTQLCINQHSYRCKFIEDQHRAELSYIYMTDNAALILAEGIKINRTLSSLNLQNILFTALGFERIANALKSNTYITTFKINRAVNPTVAERLSMFPQLSKDELAEIAVQEIRMQQYIARNNALLITQQSKNAPSVSPNSYEVEEKHTSVIPLSIFSAEQKPTVQSSSTLLLPNLSSIIPEGATADITLKLIIVYYDMLVQQIRKLNEYLDIDEEAQKEKAIISNNRKLQDYYEKLCELSFYFQASQSISTLLVSKQDDLYDMATTLAAETGKAIFQFFPVVSGLSCIIQGIETAEYIKHGIDKHRRAMNLVRFTRGIGINAEERLFQRFARKLTLMNEHQINHPDTALSRHSHHNSLMKRVVSKATSLTHKGMQKIREFREGHDYTAQQKLALTDLFKILDAVATEMIIPPVRGTEEERFNHLLASMLKFMQQEKNESLKYSPS